MAVNENEPVKCKDCNIWWRGLTHRCATVAPKIDHPDSKKKDWGKKRPYDKVSDLYGCPLCGARGPHYCPGKSPKENQLYPRIFPTGYTQGPKVCSDCGQRWPSGAPHFCPKH